jgi:hypothetical protein
MTGPTSIRGRIGTVLDGAAATIRDGGDDALTAQFVAAGMKAERGNCHRCILSHHILREVPELNWISIDPRFGVHADGPLVEYVDPEDPEGPIRSLPLPVECAGYADRFDQAPDEGAPLSDLIDHEGEQVTEDEENGNLYLDAEDELGVA